jgi:hypothetical protein
MNEWILLFELMTLPLELYLHKHHLFLAFSCSENQNANRFFKDRPPCPFQTLLQIGRDLAHGACQSFQKDWNMFKKSKSWRWFQVCFIDWLKETTVISYCRAGHGVTNLEWWATDWRKRELVSGVKSNSSSAHLGWAKGWEHFKGTVTRESITERRWHQKKKFKGFPMFLL